ncbi:hypothetical protein GCM10027176_27660 [Actinoallomurus bryophytorum]|uniref:Uncharacterized protein n=1 Tax=Actinoallomurus bryophytorum TaxID=1490222 RepID=A0A543CS70_9ACTN|nr:hypothetical protein [Actinoallomurus bryophytorum]TQL99955.1 hypothetical protein FB559_5657 [Actinoallomurus bryophytorum]
MNGFGRRLRATRAFAAERGWTFAASGKEEGALLDRLRGEPFHLPERAPDAFPYPVLGRHRHRLSDVMRGVYRDRSAIVFAYTREQEILDDGFGRRGRENSRHWIAALLDLPAPVPRVQVTPRTPVPLARPGVTIGDPRVDERFHVDAGDPVWADRALGDLAPVLLDGPARAWRVSGTSILTWTRAPSAPGIPLDQVDAALDRLATIAGRLTA